MEIGQPLWILIGLPAGAAIAWVVARRTGGAVGWRRASLRAGVVVLCLLALAEISIPVEGESIRRVYLLDLSRSFERNEALAREVIEDGARSLSDLDHVGLITFAERAAVVTPPGPPGRLLPVPALSPPGSPNASDLEAGLRRALRADPPPTEIVLLSDGRETAGDVLDAARAARSAGVPVHAIDLGIGDLPDLRLEDLRAPAQVRPGEPFRVEAIVSSSTGGEGDLELRRPPADPRRRNLTFDPGLPRRVVFEDRIDAPGLHRYEARLRGLPAEANTENNGGRAWVRVGEGIELLAISRSPARVSPLGRLPGIRLSVQAPDGAGSAGRADIIVIDNLARDDIGEARIDKIATAVRESGSGLLVLGGRRSFGPGGYAGSGLDGILPVSSDPEERRSSGISLAIVLDASGSMAETTEGDTKFRRAVMATLPIPSLGPSDRLEVITFREEAEVAVPMGPVTSQAEVREALLEIAPGGGTRLFPALERGIRDLGREEEDRVRHMIVLSDGRSEEPDGVWDEWGGLLREHPGTSISVIAVGKDVDEDRLREIVRTGDGRYYRLRGVTEAISDVYRQEVRIARGSLIRPGEAAIEPGEVGGPITGLGVPPPVFGFVATAPKEGAAVYLRTGRYPILAGWRVGLGRVLAFTSSIDTDWGRSWRSWADLPAFLSQGIRWAARPSDLGGLDPRLSIEGAAVVLEVLAEDGGGRREGLRLMAAIGDDRIVPLRQVGSGRYRARIATPSHETPSLLLLEGTADGGRRVRGAIPWDLGRRREMYDLDPDSRLLERIANLTGGSWGTGPPSGVAARGSSMRPVSSILLWVALGVFLIDLALSLLPLTRAGVRPMVRTPTQPRREGRG